MDLLIEHCRAVSGGQDVCDDRHEPEVSQTVAELWLANQRLRWAMQADPQPEDIRISGEAIADLLKDRRDHAVPILYPGYFRGPPNGRADLEHWVTDGSMIVRAVKSWQTGARASSSSHLLAHFARNAWPSVPSIQERRLKKSFNALEKQPATQYTAWKVPLP